MGYSNYKKLKQVTEKFGIEVHKIELFDKNKSVRASNWLKQTLKLANYITLSNEKVKSERIISPILTEVHITHKDKIGMFSGEDLSVEPENDLNGACDFFFSTVPDAYLLEAPIVVFAEAKDEDMDYGIAQCTAQMIGAQIFNEREGKPTETVWGCATTAGEWRFLRLTGKKLYVDAKSYYISELPVLLGVFHQIIERL